MSIMVVTVEKEMAELKNRVKHIPDVIALPPKAKFEKYLPYNLAKEFDKMAKEQSQKRTKKGKLR